MEPEWLDRLPVDDPQAVRSRRDLRWINFLMGNERWILARVAEHREAAARGIFELGAGRGDLLKRLARLGPSTGLDLAPRPDGLDASIGWKSGDVLEEQGVRGGILVANLFLHHFEAPELERIGRLAEGFEVLVFVEPLRTAEALWRGNFLLPLVGEATKHDMPTSIRAGFVAGELPRWMGLDGGWRIEERSTWRGGHRVLACRAG